MSDLPGFTAAQLDDAQAAAPLRSPLRPVTQRRNVDALRLQSGQKQGAGPDSQQLAVNVDLDGHGYSPPETARIQECGQICIQVRQRMQR